ncbi:response regulator [Odoribacter sp. OttesenSCG-928-J03]|nr:response regulator [Odoribacter sp. OttesenSCG-928-J03]
MIKVSKYTKLKVISGYLILCLLSVLLFTLIYGQLNQLAESERNVNTANDKLFIIGNTITGLYESENLSNAFILTGENNYFRQYREVIEDVQFNIDSLTILTEDSTQRLRIDSIYLLIEDKIHNLQELARAKKTFVPDERYNKAIADIEANKDSIREQINTRRKVMTTLDSSYIKSNKKRGWRLFSRAKPDSILQITVSHYTTIDSVNTRAYFQNTDSILNIINLMWHDIQNQTQSIAQNVSQKEYVLIRQSTLISEKLREILGAYEQEEMKRSVIIIENREQIARRSTQIITYVAIAALLIIVFFIFFILRDLSRSQRYRHQLEEANLYTARLLEGRKQMIRSVTHDIKSPLSSIIGYIELLNNMPINEQQRYFLKNMQGSSDHILRLVNNLLDFSKLENNKMIVENKAFNPMQLLREIHDTFIPLATAKNLTLECNIDNELDCTAQGDVLHIRQILTNILSNAVKYTERGSISFSAQTQDEGRSLLLKIEDTGLGMTPEEQKQIFNEFTRLPSGIASEGTGLGLTITLKLIHLLGGTIELESTPNQGSCFTICLPLHPDESVQTGNTPSACGDEKNNIHVLLIDDDILQLEMTANLLRQYHIQADISTEPENITERLEGHIYDIIFTDIQMPGTNGFQLVKQIRESNLPFATQIPVVALSANAENEEADYLNAGFTAYLGKPFTAAQLESLIRKLTGTSIRKNSGEVEISDNEEGYTLKNIRVFADNDETVVQQILESFVTETEKHLKQLDEYTDEQSESTANLAHKMLPMFRQLEVKHIVELLTKLESFRRTPPTDKSEIRLIVEESARLIREFIRQLSGR